CGRNHTRESTIQIPSFTWQLANFSCGFGWTCMTKLCERLRCRERSRGGGEWGLLMGLAEAIEDVFGVEDGGAVVRWIYRQPHRSERGVKEGLLLGRAEVIEVAAMAELHGRLQVKLGEARLLGSPWRFLRMAGQREEEVRPKVEQREKAVGGERNVV
ncbi:unnamed protein product, partial [Closterium sp. NIES-65]